MAQPRALQQGITTVILLCIAVSAGPIAESISAHFNTLGGMESMQSRQTLITFWGSLANMVVTAITGISITLLTVSAVFNGFGLQVSKMIGLPIGVARSAGNMVTIIIGLALSLAAVSIARGILDAVIKFAAS